ncbi:MAG: DEAD/DEAH box helicase [Yoonia sp.]|nr:DEAD/DEAH box helicase [Yoonia sp.]
MTKFSDLNLDPKVLKAIAETGYDTPTPIQAGAIVPALEGRDVLGIAQTGTGKTAAFTLPMITLLGRGRARARMPRSLVLAPTRELAAQVAENFDAYAKYTKLSKALLIGGTSFKDQDKLIDKGVDVLIATPGRLLDHLERGKLILTDVKIMVIDEADRMLDMGFIPDIEEIFKRTPFTRQTLFFSATMAPEIERITNTFLSNPAKIEVARAATTNTNIKQGVVMFKGSNKAKEPAEKRAVLRALIDREGDACTNAIIFCNRKSDVDVVAKSLNKYGYQAAPIHGDLEQSHRTRTLESFRDNELRFLVASDVAARGLDIPAVTHVFNFDVPSHAEDYVHRIGRTGRAGRSGTAIMICATRDEKNFADVERLVNEEIPRLENPLATVKSAPEDDAETPKSDAKPRSRSRTRKPREDKEKPAAQAVVAEEAKVESAPREQAHLHEREERKPRTERQERDAQAERQPQSDKQPQAERQERHQHGERQRNDRGGNTARRNDNRVVGLGDDAPAFIAKSFEERLIDPN